MELDVATLRRETPGCAARVNLDNAGAAFSPEPVLRAIRTHLDLEQTVGGYEATRVAGESIAAAYNAVGTLVGASRDNIVFLDSTTTACARVLSAIPFEPGDVILTTTNDYVSNQIMLLALAKRFGVQVVRCHNSPDGTADLDHIREILDRARPRLVSVSHVPTNSGLIQPVAEIGRLCRAVEVPYFVDACQSVGQLPIDVEEIGCDFLAASARKFLRGPRGMGFLFVSDRVLDQGLEPLFPDLHGAVWTAPDSFHAAPGARRFEYWEQPYALILGTGAAATYATRVGVPAIAARIAALAATLRQGLENLGLPVLDRGTKRAGIVTTTIAGADADACHATLSDQGISTSISRRTYAAIDFAEKQVDWALRLSPHCYNTEEEIETVLGALTQYCP
jgi:selenocysteine lyase/cysteine desulfurase